MLDYLNLFKLQNSVLGTGIPLIRFLHHFTLYIMHFLNEKKWHLFDLLQNRIFLL